MSYARGVWIEDGMETEGVVPCNWIIDNKLYWPNGISVIRHFQLLSIPDILKCKHYKYLSTKCVGDEQTCQDYEFVTAQDEKSASEELLIESSDKEDTVVPKFPNAMSLQSTLISTPQLSTFKSSCSVQKMRTKTSIHSGDRLELSGINSIRKIAIPSRKLNQTKQHVVKRRHGYNYPLTNEIFQKTVINLLTEISIKLKDITVCGCNNSATTILLPSTNESFKFLHITSMEELCKLNSDLVNDANFTSFKTQLSRIGGKSIKTIIKNILQSFLPNATQALCNMYGSGEKFGLSKSNIYRAIVDVVLFKNKEATTASTICQTIMLQLKHAPRQSNGGGSNIRKIPTEE